VITKKGSRETRSAWRGTFFLLVLGDQEMLTEEDRRGGPHDMSDEQEEEGMMRTMREMISESP
jgi:hypothetical protein